ncbi:MAG: hypothetical protein AB7O97_00690 [Planctomycetota bacterium]
MTVHGLDYRPGPYRPTGRLQRLWPLAVVEFRSLFRGKWSIALFLVCAFPSLVRLVLLLFWLGVLGVGGDRARRAGAAAPGEFGQFVPTNIDFYVEQVVAPNHGLLPLLVLTALTTARAVAKDRATNALELYWTRGISPLQYFAGKWLGALMQIGTLTVGVPVVLWVVGVIFAEDWSFAADTIGFMPRAVLGLGVFTALLAALGVLVSAFSAGANVATVLWCLLVGGSQVVAELLGILTRDDYGAWISVWDAAAALARTVAGSAGPGDSAAGAAILLGGLGALLVALARRRLRITEAVG